MLRSQIAIGVGIGIALTTATAALAQLEHGCEHEDTLESHIGHVMWCWDDTPGHHGLLVTALAEGETALEYAALAAAGSADLATIRANLAQVVHALDPRSEPEGEGLGYGLSLAAEGAAVHISFALQAENSFGIEAADGDGYDYGNGDGDAIDSALDQAFDETAIHETSDFVRVQAELATLSLANASAWSAEALALAQAARGVDDPAAARSEAGEVLAALRAAMSGRDLDGDGVISAAAGEGGLSQAHEAMLAIIAEESLTNPYAG